MIVFLKRRRPPRSTRTDTLFPYTTLFRSVNLGVRHSEVRFTSDDRYITADNPDDSGRLRYSRSSPVAGVLFRATPEVSIYANAGGGFETPTFSELAYRPDSAGGPNDLGAARSPELERRETRRVGKECVSAVRARGASDM